MRRDKRGRLVCWCGNYWFPHRHGGGACEHSKTSDIHLAIRAKDSDRLMEALIAFAFDYPEKLFAGGVCPF